MVLTVYDTAIPTQSKAFLFALAQIAALFVALDLTLRAVRSWLIGALGARVEQELSEALFQKLVWLPVSNIQAASLFQQVQRIKQFDSIRDSLTGSFLLTLIDLPFAILFIGLIALFAPMVGVFLAVAAVIFCAAILFVTRIQVARSVASSSTKAQYDALVHETSMRLGTIRGLALAPDMENRFAGIEDAAERAAMDQRVFQACVEAGGQAFVALVGVGAVGLTTLYAMDGAVSFGALIVVITLVWRLLGTFKSLLVNGQKFVSLNATLQQAMAVLDQTEEMRRRTMQARMKDLDAPLSMHGVFLRFNAVNEPALLNVALDIPRGALVAVSGSSGSGKSTLLQCFTKIISPTNGAVRIAGIDYRQLAVEDIRNSVSLAPGDTWFFPISLRDNFRIGNPGLTDAAILDMCARIGADRELRRFLDGLDTIMNRATTARLSRMQMRSLSLARALCRPANVYLLDDAMVGVSATGADRIWSVLEAMKGDKTILVVTNKLDQIRRADHAITLDEGRITISAPGPEAARKLRLQQDHV